MFVLTSWTMKARCQNDAPLPSISKMIYCTTVSRVPFIFRTPFCSQQTIFSHPLKFRDKHKALEDVCGWVQTPAVHMNHSFDRKWAMWRICQYLHEGSTWQWWSFILMDVFTKQNKWSIVVPIKVVVWLLDRWEWKTKHLFTLWVSIQPT